MLQETIICKLLRIQKKNIKWEQVRWNQMFKQDWMTEDADPSGCSKIIYLPNLPQLLITAYTTLELWPWPQLPRNLAYVPPWSDCSPQASDIPELDDISFFYLKKLWQCLQFEVHAFHEVHEVVTDQAQPLTGLGWIMPGWMLTDFETPL